MSKTYTSGDGIIIEAIQWKSDNIKEIEDCNIGLPWIKKCKIGDYIIMNPPNDPHQFYSCNEDVFKNYYYEGRHSNATGHIFDKDKKKWVRRVEVKYMIRIFRYIETEKSKKAGIPTELVSDFVSDSNEPTSSEIPTSKRIDFATIKPLLVKFDSEEEAANYIKDKLYRFMRFCMYEIVKVYN